MKRSGAIGARRVVVRTGAIATALVVATAAPASAHTVTGVQPTNYKSQIVAVAPAIPGLELKLLDLGRRVQLTNTSGVDVIVLGYQNEPYLRVGPEGTFENRRSPTTYRNRATTPSLQSPVPPEADPNAAPEWHKTGDSARVRWRDQRTRWEGSSPPAVKANPDKQQVVSQWTIAMRRGDQAVAATGLITWVPGPSALPWLLLALAALVATAALGWPGNWGRLLAVALAVLLGIDVVHSFGNALAAQYSVAITVLRVVFLGFITTLAWIGAAWSVPRLQRNNEIGMLVGAMSGFVMALYAVSDTTGLGRSQLPYAFPSVTARVAVTLTLGIGFGLVAAAVVVFKRNPGLVTRSSAAPQ